MMSTVIINFIVEKICLIAFLILVNYILNLNMVIRHSLGPDTIPGIVQIKGSCGPGLVASRSHCEAGQYLTSDISL